MSGTRQRQGQGHKAAERDPVDPQCTKGPKGPGQHLSIEEGMVIGGSRLPHGSGRQTSDTVGEEGRVDVRKQEDEGGSQDRSKRNVSDEENVG